MREGWKNWHYLVWRKEDCLVVCCYKEDGNQLFSVSTGDGTRGNGLKLKQGKFSQEIRKNILTPRLVKHRNRLPRKVVESPSLEVAKCRLDKRLSHMVQQGSSCLESGSLNDLLRFLPALFIYDSVILPSFWWNRKHFFIFARFKYVNRPLSK